MITTCFKGGMGNQMFQYALGRIIAEAKGYKLEISDPDNRGNLLFDQFKNAGGVEGDGISLGGLAGGIQDVVTLGGGRWREVGVVKDRQMLAAAHHVGNRSAQVAGQLAFEGDFALVGSRI